MHTMGTIFFFLSVMGSSSLKPERDEVLEAAYQAKLESRLEGITVIADRQEVMKQTYREFFMKGHLQVVRPEEELEPVAA